MRKYLLLLLALLVPFVAFSASPIQPEVAARLDQLPYVVKVTYDVAANSNGSSTVNSGAHGLGAYLPAGALITRSWMRIQTAFTDDSNGTVAFSCEDANNILTAEDMTNDALGYKAGSVTSGVIANQCEITATVANDDQDTGKLVLYVEYFLNQ